MFTFYLFQRTGFAWRPSLFLHRYIHNYKRVKWTINEMTFNVEYVQLSLAQNSVQTWLWSVRKRLHIVATSSISHHIDPNRHGRGNGKILIWRDFDNKMILNGKKQKTKNKQKTPTKNT